ncbi:hypothetical protein pRALTA_0074 (plasmid) [Cupriavidus taiwanensis LMG 19424]|uniref:Uncharacterized protein n=1 Tax=Cupriavidus taiwanensis (strain DSM 17343 / BCRC 17206 / CCUG 44338 / CIP 107171 / LMG 19424 / R1) TaxID=977880 RepID=B2AJU7_CUPTR|nr:hypothetical protein pRALTA_0074 [Cupriavidus taiwanensis LMG 19424]
MRKGKPKAAVSHVPANCGLRALCRMCRDRLSGVKAVAGLHDLVPSPVQHLLAEASALPYTYMIVAGLPRRLGAEHRSPGRTGYLHGDSDCQTVLR